MNPTTKLNLVRPEILSRLSRGSIAALLSPYADYFAARGAPLGDFMDPGTPLHNLESVLASPVESTPSELIERLELLDLISDRQSAIAFEDGFGELVAKFGDENDTAADLAAKILLHAPEIAWREFDRQVLQARRVRVSYRIRPDLCVHTPTPERIERLRSLLVPWFKANARSGFCEVHVRSEPDGAAFVIRHGDLLKRLGVCDEDGSRGIRILRPERVDVAHYHSRTGEWQITGMGIKLQEAYRQAFGAAFHGSAKALLHSERYSLEPLREGYASLRCDPAGQVQFAELNSLKLELSGGQHLCVANGRIFDALDSINPQLLRTAILREARLSLKLATRRRRVQIVVCPQSDKVAGIHFDPAIDAWLTAKGFARDFDESVLLASA